MPGSPGSREFFVAGGTLHPDAPSYVERPADRQLRELVQAGELCYVLTTRQMGKSSLVVRTAGHLNSLGICTATIDLTLIGSAPIEEWYLSLLDELQSQLPVKTDAEDWWGKNSSLSCVRRFTKYIQEVVVPEVGGQVAIFIDEIDSVLNLDFADDFFAAIRAMYNRDGLSSEERRVSFILLGVAAPDDLVKDQSRTPFNIGVQIRLDELALTDAAVLLKGLPGENKTILERIFYWTSGHPYLTQSIGQAIAQEERRGWTLPDVDSLVHDHFFTREAFFSDSNLRFVHNRVTSSPDSDELLRLYGQIRRRGRVKSIAQSPIQKSLLLYGLVGSDAQGYLSVRNRIYDRVFDKKWIKENDPVSWWEVLPQSIKIATISILLLLVAFAVAAVVAVRNAQRAEEGTLLALSRQLIAESTASTHSQYDLSLLLGLEALNILDTQETLGIVRYGLTANPYILAFLRGDEGVDTVSLRHDGRLLATGGENGQVLLWDPKNLVPVLSPLTAHRSGVSALSFARNGTYLISGGCGGYIEGSDICSSGELAIWDLAAEGALLKMTEAHDDQIRVIAPSADGRVFATGGGTSLVLWDLANLEPIWRLDLGQENEITSLAFSPTDPDLLVYGDGNGQVGIVNLADETVVLELDAHDDRVTNVSFSPDGQLLGSSGRDGAVTLWDAGSWEPKYSPFLAHVGTIYDVEFEASDAFITAGADGRVVRWAVSEDAGEGIQEIDSLTGHGGLVWSMSLADTPDGKVLATNGPDNSAILWSLIGDRSRGRWLTGHKGSVLGIDFSPDGSVLASAGEDRTIRLWNVEEYAPLGPPLESHQDAVRRVAFHPEGIYLASAGRDGKVILWDLLKGQAGQQELIGHNSIVRGVTFSPDGGILASSDDSGTILLWDVEKAERIGAPLKRKSREIFDIDFSPDGSILAAGYWDGTVQLWDIQSLEPLGDPITTGIEQVWDVEFSPDGNILAVGGSGEIVPLLDVASRTIRNQLLTNQVNRINAIAFSGDGSFLATGGADSTIVIWDVSSRHSVGLPLTMHSDEVYTLQFSPDGSILASADLAGGIFLSVIKYDDPTQTVCAIASRSLTREEWSQYIGSDVGYEESCPEHAN